MPFAAPGFSPCACARPIVPMAAITAVTNALNMFLLVCLMTVVTAGGGLLHVEIGFAARRRGLARHRGRFPLPLVGDGPSRVLVPARVLVVVAREAVAHLHD